MKPYDHTGTVACVECGLTYYRGKAIRTGKWLGLRAWKCQNCVDEEAIDHKRLLFKHERK